MSDAYKSAQAESATSLPHLLPPLGIFLVVVGSIYGGIATPTEAASLGVVASLVLAWSAGKLSFAMLKEAVEGTIRSTAMVMLLVIIVFFYVVLGCFMETLSMMITTIPIIVPVMFKLGFDPVWFGIVIIVLIETALVTPPVGLNLFVVQNLRKSGSLNDVIIGTLLIVVALFVILGLLAAFPDLALWLPRVVG